MQPKLCMITKYVYFLVFTDLYFSKLVGNVELKNSPGRDRMRLVLGQLNKLLGEIDLPWVHDELELERKELWNVEHNILFVVIGAQVDPEWIDWDSFEPVLMAQVVFKRGYVEHRVGLKITIVLVQVESMQAFH